MVTRTFLHSNYSSQIRCNHVIHRGNPDAEGIFACINASSPTFSGCNCGQAARQVKLESPLSRTSLETNSRHYLYNPRMTLGRNITNFRKLQKSSIFDLIFERSDPIARFSTYSCQSIYIISEPHF